MSKLRLCLVPKRQNFSPKFLKIWSVAMSRYWSRSISSNRIWYVSLLSLIILFIPVFQRMLQDYNATQTDFRRVVTVSASDRRPMGSGQGDAGQYPGMHPMARQVDPNQYQLFLSRMQTQIDSFNAIREIGRKFLDSSSTQLGSSGK